MDGYLKGEGRLRGCPVTIVARRGQFIIVSLDERRGIWEKGEKITIEENEIRTSGTGSINDPFADLCDGKTDKNNKYRYQTVSGEQPLG